MHGTHAADHMLAHALGHKISAMKSWSVARRLASKISVRSTEFDDWLENTGFGNLFSTESGHNFKIFESRFALIL